MDQDGDNDQGEGVLNPVEDEQWTPIMSCEGSSDSNMKSKGNVIYKLFKFNFYKHRIGKIRILDDSIVFPQSARLEFIATTF